ncbi:MAG: asparagine synthase (glutamine-hydrolyzing) [Parasphingorhabdus sp.]|jgi:asparagine synthase (glutamine-hydrolysing)
MPFLLAVDLEGKLVPSFKQIVDRIRAETHVTCELVTREHSKTLLVATQPTCIHLSQPKQGNGTWVVLDGYLANVQEISRLAGESVQYSNQAELLSEAYRKLGPSLLDMLSGSFLVVVVEIETQRLYSRRDNMGSRTAYYHRSGNLTIMASQASWIASSTAYIFKENPVYLSSLFSSFYPSVPGESPFHDITEMLPGERLTVSDRGVSASRTDIDLHSDSIAGPETEWLEQFESLFRGAVSESCATGGNVAIMLSGGMDSAPVAAMARQVVRGTGRKLIATSWALPEFPEADESIYIAQNAKFLDLKLELFNGSALLPYSNLLEKSIVSPEFPVLNGCRALILECYRLAALHQCQTILNGHTGDQLYPDARVQLYDLINRRCWGELSRSVMAMVTHNGLAGTFRCAEFRYPFSRMYRSVKPLKNPSFDWLTPFALENIREQETWPPECNDHTYPAYAERLLGWRMAWGIAHENSFCRPFGIERRDPFQNEKLVRFFLNLPTSMSHRNGRTKWLMREIMQGKIPENIRAKSRTGLLSSFIMAGFEHNRDSIHDILFNKFTAWQRYVRADVVRRGITDPNAPPREKLLVNHCLGYVLWLQHWTDI